jgi:Lrp/AsnC family transcriptional regulator for asnA, asnC and gidA
MDELDNQIIKILQRDGRASNAGIARDVGVSEGTVRRRLKRLVQEEFIQVVALPDPTKMGLESQALIGVQVDPDKIDQVADGMSDLDEIKWVAITTGSYDIFAWSTLPSAESLGIFLRTKVGVIPGVRRTETFVNLANKKRGYGIVI